MIEPYSIEVNLKRNRIIFHYEKAPDFIIDKKEARKYVQKDIDGLMPKKSTIDKMVLDELNAIKKKHPELKAWLGSEEAKKAALERVTNRLKSELEEILAVSFAEDKINELLCGTWKTLLELKEEN